MWGSGRKFWRNDDGAVAPMVALSLVALIAVGGIAFDYAHVAALDTELQDAADQAALAAATQLDGQSGAIARATAAAQSLVTNKTYFANDGTSSTVSIQTITFCSAFDDSKADTAAACTTTPLDSAARVVWVKVGPRTANYALTPIVSALTSGKIGGEADAGMNSAVCKEPPVMMCNPNTDPTTFDVSSYIGKGILLIAKGSGASYAPGDFGFLDVGAGASDLGKLMAYGSPPDKCVDVTNPSTETGAMTSVINDFNTRFDIFESGDSNNCFGGSLCPPSQNSRKDVVMNHSSPFTKNNCGIVTGGGGNGWVVSSSPYRPVTTPTTSAQYVGNYTATPDAMGYPRDTTHATSAADALANRVGNGNWDIDAYWRVNHPVGSADPHPAVLLPSGKYGYPTTLNSTIRAVFPLSVDSSRTYPTRYQVYRWEMANAAAELPSAGRTVGSNKDYGQPVCRPGSAPGGSSADRRTLPIAVVNCTGLNGKKPVNPIDWVDSFLVEPSMSRDNGLSGKNNVTYSNVGDIYVEIIGHTGNGSGGTNTQFIRHDRPYLIR
jgi:Flp pilus assembly protein TadG